MGKCLSSLSEGAKLQSGLIKEACKIPLKSNFQWDNYFVTGMFFGGYVLVYFEGRYGIIEPAIWEIGMDCK